MKWLNILVLVVIAAVLVMVVGGSLAGSAAEGFARGGGEMRVLSPSTEATAGDNGVAVSVQGDSNSIAVAWSQGQPTPVPAMSAEENAKDAEGMHLAGTAIIAIVVIAVLLFVAVLMGFV